MSGRGRTIVAALAGAGTLAIACTAGANGATPAAVSAKKASVRLLECSGGKSASDRWALFRGQMKQVPDGALMRMRFHLSERVGRDGWRSVSAPALDVWHDSRPGVSKLAYRQRIEALQKGTAYRVTVQFRWYDESGALLARQSARSKACRQRGQLPNLAIRRVEVEDGVKPDTARYTVSFANSGSVTARGFEITLLVDGAEVDVRPIGRLGAGDKRAIRFVGPVCGSTAEARIDSADAVREATESDNVRSVGCPSRK
jgi:CARDB